MCKHKLEFNYIGKAQSNVVHKNISKSHQKMYLPWLLGKCDQIHSNHCYKFGHT